MDSKNEIATKILKNTDRLVYCPDCSTWDATRDKFLKSCRYCSSPHIHQAPHKKWAAHYYPLRGYVMHGHHAIAVLPGSLAARVLSFLQQPQLV